MSEEKLNNAQESGSLTADALEAEDVLADSEPWEPIETKMVVWSFVIAFIALIIGLLIVPTSILH